MTCLDGLRAAHSTDDMARPAGVPSLSNQDVLNQQQQPQRLRICLQHLQGTVSLVRIHTWLYAGCGACNILLSPPL